MSRKALVVIDIQNDITKHYRDIIENINFAIDWAVKQEIKDSRCSYWMIEYERQYQRNESWFDSIL